MAQHLPAPWMAGAILGGACLLCCARAALRAGAAAALRDGRYWRSLVDVVMDLWRLSRARVPASWRSSSASCRSASGAASGLWSAVADDWHASADTVALVTGVLGGIVSAVGCLVGGWLCDRMNRKTAYALYGVLQALCAVAMALAPRTEPMYIVFTTIYAFITGLTYAGFTAFVLEAMGPARPPPSTTCSPRSRTCRSAT